MNPAPPVTRRLPTAELSEDGSQAAAPMKLLDAERGERALVQHAVARPTGGRRVLFRRYRTDRHRRRQQTHWRGLLSDRNRVIIPAGNACVGPMVYSTH